MKQACCNANTFHYLLCILLDCHAFQLSLRAAGWRQLTYNDFQHMFMLDAIMHLDWVWYGRSVSYTSFSFNTLRTRQNDWYFVGDILECIFLNENVWVSNKISLHIVPLCSINTLRPRQSGRHFAYDIFKCFFFEWRCLNCDWNFTEICS